MDNDISLRLQETVQKAVADNSPLNIIGGDSKSFLGCTPQGKPFNVSDNRGIINYEPTELVITARAGTLLSEIEAALDAEQQMLGFEPPHFDNSATLGGTIACGLSGPRRPYTGAARDFVLGCKIINGRGEILHFGGEVMKNVAGYDVSRLMNGAFGTLGIILEVSLKVLPKPIQEITLVQQRTDKEAIKIMNIWAGQSIPISATAYYGDQLYVRLSGSENVLKSARSRIGGEALNTSESFWHSLKEQQHAFFSGPKPLWRIMVPQGEAPLALEGKTLIEWGGAQRWLKSDFNPSLIHDQVLKHNGHATLYRDGECDGDIFQALPASLFTLHKNLKQAFDPVGIFNPGRLYPEL